jgi:hypothetical protein
MNEFKLTSISNINFATEGKTFKLTAGLTGSNIPYVSVELDIDADQIKSKTIAEIEEMALRKVRS